jgi:hypothetical protein
MNKTILALMGTLSAAAFGMSCSDSVKEKDPAPGTAWKDMKREERLAYMKKTVFPKMKAEFVTFDADTYKDMTCATCHGDGAKDKSFKMPNPKLPHLPTTEAGMKKMRDDCPGVFDFMAKKVAPDMAALLGEAPYDPKTHQGFGCFRCHTKKE